MLQLQHLRNQYWDFTKDTARKQWFKELVLPGVPDDLDAELKQFTLLEVPVCYNYLRQLFGCSNNLLIGIKGTNWARGHISVEASRQSRIGFPFKNYEFTKREEIVLWLSYQKHFYELQPDRDEVLLPWSFKGEVYRQYVLNPKVGDNTVIEFVEMIDSLVPWKQNIEKYLVPTSHSVGNHMYCLLRIKREGNEVKYQVKRSVHELNGPWTDYRSRAERCQEITNDNIPLMSDIFKTFDKPYVIPPLPLTDGKEVEYKKYMACINGNAHRIHMAYADLEVSAPIVQSFVNEVEAMRQGREIPFNWDTPLYT